MGMGHEGVYRNTALSARFSENQTLIQKTVLINKNNLLSQQKKSLYIKIPLFSYAKNYSQTCYCLHIYVSAMLMYSLEMLNIKSE